MIETSKRQERVILLGVELPETENFEMSMEELASLAKTAGAEVVSSYRQKREKYDSKSLIGSGKLAEIKAIVEADEIDTVIVNDRLTPRQNVNLEVELGVKVIDRMQLILDIFAMRARSHEGKLQVHLAQLKPSRLLHWKISGFRPLEDFIDIVCRTPPAIIPIGSV